MANQKSTPGTLLESTRDYMGRICTRRCRGGLAAGGGEGARSAACGVAASFTLTLTCQWRGRGLRGRGDVATSRGVVTPAPNPSADSLDPFTLPSLLPSPAASSASPLSAATICDKS